MGAKACTDGGRSLEKRSSKKVKGDRDQHVDGRRKGADRGRKETVVWECVVVVLVGEMGLISAQNVNGEAEYKVEGCDGLCRPISELTAEERHEDNAEQLSIESASVELLWCFVIFEYLITDLFNYFFYFFFINLILKIFNNSYL